MERRKVESSRLRQSELRELKLSLIIFLITASISLFLFEGRSSPFAPGQIMASFQTLDTGLPVQAETTKGFHLLNATLFSITGISPYEALYAPILMIPISAVLFGLVWRFSGSLSFTALLIGGYLLSGANGHDKLFIGVHGVGAIILFTLLLLTITHYQRSDSDNGSIYAIFIGTLALTYISYNRSAQSILFFGFIAVVLFGTRYIGSIEDTVKYKLGGNYIDGIILAGFAVIAHLFFHNFAINIFIPYFSSKIFSGTTSFDLFMARFFGEDTGAFALSELILTTPDYIVYLSVSKYIFILGALMLFIEVISYRIRQYNELSSSELILLAFTAAMASFAVVRIFIGNIPIAYAYLPGLLSVAYLYNIESVSLPKATRSRVRDFCLVAVIGLIVTSGAFASASVSSDTNVYDKSHFQQTDRPGQWHQQYIDEPIRSDELTANLLELHTYRSDRMETRRLGPPDVLALHNRAEFETSEYYVLNYDLEVNTLGGWQNLGSWRQSSTTINNNRDINNLYDSGPIETYKP